MRIEVGGAVEESAKANAALFKIFPLMFLAMLTILMLQLQRFSTLFLVFSTAPLGLIGASFSLLAFNAPFGFNALLGLIALAGMIMRNTVILVDQIDADVASGLSRWDAIIESTVRRSRPLVLTAMAAIFAMIPLSRSVFWGPMAITMMGGLLVATILTLLFLPALYAAWFRIHRPKVEATVLLPQAQEPVGSSPDNVAIWAQAADDALDRARQLRMPMKLVAGMDVGDVDLDDGSVERLARIINRNGRERVAGRIDDDGVRALARRLNKINEVPLVVQLLECQGCADIFGERHADCLDRGERG